jgi:hypothetical protein
MRVWVAIVAVGCGRVSFDAQRDAVTAPPDAAPTFVDTFDRSDTVFGLGGNGWSEKTSPTFKITSQHVQRIDFTRDYRDSLAYLPDDVLDVDVSMEMTVGHAPPGYPQIHARVQRSTLATANTLDGYLLYVDGLAGDGLMTAMVTRQHGATLPPPLATFTLSPELAVGQSYRLRLIVRGTAPVQLDAFVEHRAAETWTTIGTISTIDTDATAVVTAGAVGFDVGQPEAAGYYTYDTFTYTAL